MFSANLQVPHVMLRNPLREGMGKVRLREGKWLAKVTQLVSGRART